MTQIYRINVDSIKNSEIAGVIDPIPFHEVVREWALFQPQYGTMVRTGQLEQEQADVLYANNQHRVGGYAMLYRKNSRNYLWRGKFVHSALHDRICQAVGEEKIEGTLLLYKRGSINGGNATHYPIRMSNNRYAIVAGSIQHILRWALDQHEIKINTHPYLTMFDQWASEHLLDYEVMKMNQKYMVRAQYCWLLDQFMNDDAFNMAFYDYDAEVPRAAYCVWKDGEIIRWANAGKGAHPKI